MTRHSAPFCLNAEDQSELESWLRKKTLNQSLAQRARILLALNVVESPKVIAENLG